TEFPALDTIELLNLTAVPVDLQHHFLSDAASTIDSLAKFHVSSSTVVLGNEFINFDESDFNPTPLNPGPNDFGLSSLGDQVYLTVGNATGPTHFVDDVVFNAAENGVSFIPHTTSDNRVYITAEQATTLTDDQTNAPFLVGNVVISELHYHPLAGTEFIEIHNRSDVPVDLFDPVNGNTWQIDGIGFQFPAATVLAVGEVALVSPIDPTTFRQEYGVDPRIQIFGPYSGSLNNAGERISLQRPGAPEILNNEILVPYIDVDYVNYDDAAPWPVDADALGDSLQRLTNDNFGSDPASWDAAVATPGIASYGAEPISVAFIDINSVQQDPPDLNSGPQPTSWAAQRSYLASIRVVLSEPAAAILPSDIRLLNLGKDADNDQDVEFNLLPEHVSHSGSLLTLTFAPQDLSEGVYSLELLDTIVDLQGQQLDGDGDGAAGGSHFLVGNSGNGLYRLTSEFNGDFGVSVFDFSTFSYWFGQSVGAAPLYADMNVDGGVSVFDFTLFSLNFGASIRFPTSFAQLDFASAKPDGNGEFEVADELRLAEGQPRELQPIAELKRRTTPVLIPLGSELASVAVVDLAIEALAADDWRI
ncbi:MAG: hypothetical protein ACI9G1_001116, partial [Pirellulaceae bacterium]